MIITSVDCWNTVSFHRISTDHVREWNKSKTIFTKERHRINHLMVLIEVQERARKHRKPVICSTWSMEIARCKCVHCLITSPLNVSLALWELQVGERKGTRPKRKTKIGWILKALMEKGFFPVYPCLSGRSLDSVLSVFAVFNVGCRQPRPFRRFRQYVVDFPSVLRFSFDNVWN